MTEKFRLNPIQFAGVVDGEVISGVSIATTGEAVGHRLMFDQTSLAQLQLLASSKPRGVKSRFTHPDWFHDGLGKYLGRFTNFQILEVASVVPAMKLVADLQLSKTSHTSPAGDIGQYVLDLAGEDPSALGVSVVVDLQRERVEGQDLPVARITQLYAADVVDEPSLNPDGLFEITEQGSEILHQIEGEQEMPDNEMQDRVTQLEATIEKLSKQLENGVIQIGNQPPRGQQVAGMPAAVEQFQAYFDWLFGAPGAQLPPPELRRADALYRAVTGDLDIRGVFDPTRTAFAAATTTTLADLAVNAMNKVVIDLYTNLVAYRWFEQIVAVQPTDGTLQDMQWLQFGGIGNLPVVAEGAAYTELDVTDTKETSAFYKYGGYVGITDKMIRNSKIDQIQAVPRALTISAIRTRSAAIASIFTQATGTGPTLTQDSTVLFHANHGNVATTAYSIAAWKAARLECVKQAELGSAKRQVLWPRFLLVPADLYDQALIDFGYGAGPGGYPGTPNNDVNPYAEGRPGDPRPSVIAVPEWTDTNDWAYIVDPAIAPVICMAYGDNPGGRSHPAPQLYSVTDPSSGLLFTNDTLPIKVRDLWAYGVATYRGIGKRNVA
jgi:HK97 family phage major capsid protein